MHQSAAFHFLNGGQASPVRRRAATRSEIVSDLGTREAVPRRLPARDTVIGTAAERHEGIAEVSQPLSGVASSV